MNQKIILLKSMQKRFNFFFNRNVLLEMRSIMGNSYCKLRIEKITKTTIVCNNSHRYRITDGSEINDQKLSSRTDVIMVLDEESEKKYKISKLESERLNLIKELSSIRVSDENYSKLDLHISNLRLTLKLLLK